VRTIRIYELDITYPDGSHRYDAELDDDVSPEVDGVWRPRWPQERRFLSRTAAVNRAKNLSALGCTVAVRQSAPIAFEDDPAVHFDPQPSTPPAMECTSKEGL
jgi:hypothetical protein